MIMIVTATKQKHNEILRKKKINLITQNERKKNVLVILKN